MNRETGKDRWRRVPKDYFRKPDRLQRGKLLLSWTAGALALGWFATGFDWTGSRGSPTDLNSLRANHGELARVHTAWEQKCDACHVPFEPIDGRALLAASSSAAGRSSDQLCMSCHAGPSHHEASMKSDVKGCAECHRDHQGKDFSLVRLDDKDCTSCHSALHSHTDMTVKPKGSREYRARIIAFDSGNHPAFRSENADYPDKSPPVDRGKLKFNHALHMSPGMVRKPGDRPYDVGQIPVAEERARYGKNPSDAVQLDCQSCHLLDASDRPPTVAAATSSSPSRSKGDYYQAVSYQTQCRACHPLTFDPKSPGLEAPHLVPPGEVTGFLRRTYAGQLLSEKPEMLEEFRPKVTIPGKAPVDPALRKRYEDAVASAESFLFENKSNCKECHVYSGGIDHGVVPKAIEPTRVPEVWYSHASFDHTAHRGVSCRECHSKAYAVADDGKTAIEGSSRTEADVLIPGIDNCVQCHAPARREGGWFARSPAKLGGASASCVECHRYHNGDRPSQGPGALAQDATQDRTIAQFLEGAGGSRTSPPSPAGVGSRP